MEENVNSAVKPKRIKKEEFMLNGFEKLLRKIGIFFVNLGLGIFNFFRYLPRTVGRFFAKIGRGFARYGKNFVRGSVSTKISYFIMGWRSLTAKRFVKGILMLAIEAAYIVFMVMFGGKALMQFGTLGTVGVTELPSGGIQLGDNSMLILLYGLATILLTIGFVCLYILNVQSAYKTDCILRAGNRVPTFTQDIKALLNEKFHITLMAVPVTGILIFNILPLIYMILTAFTNYDKLHQPPANLFTWTGFSTFASVFTDPRLSGTFFPILLWTLIWAVLATVSNYFGGIIVALLINKKGIRGKAVFRTIFVLTIAIPQFVSLLIMRNMLNVMGPVNGILQNLGWISEPIDFLGSSAYGALLPKTVILLVNLWVGIPYTMLITTGILMNIPADLYEAARIDGANAFKMFMRITMPYVLFVTAPYLITQFIGNINNFNLIFLLTGGNPFNSGFYGAGHTDLLITWLYKLTADQKDYNLASVIGILTFVISAVISLISYSQTSSYKREDDFQ